MSDESPSCKYTAQIERTGNQYVIEVPSREVDLGTLSLDDVCQVTLTIREHDHASPDSTSSSTDSTGDEVPVSVGEQLTVEIEDTGQHGDGITRVDQGYVLIIPGSEVGDEVTVEVQQTNPTYGFAEVVDNTSADETADTEAEVAPAETNSDGLTAEPDPN